MSEFTKDLAKVINYHSKENESGTPDFILANFLSEVLDAYSRAILARTDWRGEEIL